MQQLKFEFASNDVRIKDTINEVKISGVGSEVFLNKPLKTVSLFCGCGGMDLGFLGGFKVFGREYASNPFEIIYANDIEPHATQTYSHNFKETAVCSDIKDINSEVLPKDIDVVIGGFPCQDFSHAGKRRGLGANRGRLYQQMARIIYSAQPKAFVAENVDGLRTIGEDESALKTIMSEFAELGYDVRYNILNAADYGIPQTRKRIIIIGIKKDLGKQIYFPAAEFFGDSNPRWISAKEAIDDLWDAVGTDRFSNHSEKDYSRAKFYPGQRMQGNNRIRPDAPSPTIRAEHHGNIEAHYRTIDESDSENPANWRRLSVRECARLQSFPDDFVFPVSASRAYKQIGNAVPPVMAWHIARALYFSLSS